ncbi:toxin-antitoxin system YwqK family antitoxin [Pseudohongiella sp.]|nr:hypothetical protein [Pseudohongiella sp.]
MSVSASGIIRSGTISGNKLSYSVSYPEDGGTLTGSGTITFDGAAAYGSSNWSWTGGSLTCVGTSSISAALLSSPTPTPQPIGTAPALTYLLTGTKIDLSWSATSAAQSYTLFYAPYPAMSPIYSLELGQALLLSERLSVSDAFYIAIQANLEGGGTLLSNIESFHITGVDVVEISDPKSDISAIIYGENGNSLVTLNSSSTSEAVLNFKDGKQGVMLGDINGRLLELRVEGFTAKLSYGLGTKQITITAPDGSTSMLSTSSLSQAASCSRPSECSTAAGIVSNLESDEVSVFERLVDDAIDTFRNISTVPFCAQPVGAPVCNTVETYAERADTLRERLTNRVQTNISRIGNALTCTVSTDKCSETAAKEAPKILRQLNNNTSITPPTAGFNIGAEKATPKDAWKEYLGDGSFTMVELPCSEDVFASMRPECGGDDVNSPTGSGSGDGSVAPESPNIDASFDNVIARCVDTPADIGCFNAEDFPIGVHKHFSNVNTNRYLSIEDHYSGYTLKRTRYYASGAVSYTSSSVYIENEYGTLYWAEDGESKSYYEDGTLKLIQNFKRGALDGISNHYRENGVIRTSSTYKDGKLDGALNTYDSNGKLINTSIFSNGVKISSTNF